jgi:hypothetical protein
MLSHFMSRRHLGVSLSKINDTCLDTLLQGVPAFDTEEGTEQVFSLLAGLRNVRQVAAFVLRGRRDLVVVGSKFLEDGNDVGPVERGGKSEDPLRFDSRVEEGGDVKFRRVSDVDEPF